MSGMKRDMGKKKAQSFLILKGHSNKRFKRVLFS